MDPLTIFLYAVLAVMFAPAVLAIGVALLLLVIGVLCLTLLAFILAVGALSIPSIVVFCKFSSWKWTWEMNRKLKQLSKIGKDLKEETK